MVNSAFFMIFAVFDPSPLTVRKNCIFCIYGDDFFCFLLYERK